MTHIEKIRKFYIMIFALTIHYYNKMDWKETFLFNCMVLLYSLFKKIQTNAFLLFIFQVIENQTLLVNTDTLYICTYEDVGMEILGISFVGMSMPRKVPFLYNFRKWNIISKKKEQKKREIRYRLFTRYYYLADMWQPIPLQNDGRISVLYNTCARM